MLTKNPNFYLVLNIFYCQIGLILFIDCPLRNLIAIGLFLLGIQELNKGRKLSFVFYIVLATTFHQSAIFFIVIPLVYKMRKLSSIKLIILVFFCYVLFISQNLLIKLLEYLPFFQERLFHLLGSEYSEGKIFTLGNLEKILMIIIMLYYHYKNKKNWKIIFLAVLYLILYRIGTTFPILTRMALYLQIFYIFGIGLIIEKIRKSFKLILILLFGLYGVLIIYKITNNTYKYIPYTNYLKYIGVEKPSYEYRSKYNLIKWSERTGKSIEELRRN